MTNRGATPDHKSTPAPTENGALSPIDMARAGHAGRKPARTPPVRRRKAALSIAEASAGMLVQKLSVRAPDVVFVKGIIEASEGIALIFAERGGELTIAAPLGREAELGELLEDIAREVGGELGPLETAPGAAAATSPLADETQIQLQKQKDQQIQQIQKMQNTPPAEGVRGP